MGDDAAQPVVGVDDVGAAGGREVLEHPVGELVDDVGQRLLGEVMRSGLDVHDPVAGLDRAPRGQARAVGPGVRGALDPGLRQRRHDLADVDVHPAAVARPGLEQRRRVEGDHGNAMHQEIKR